MMDSPGYVVHDGCDHIFFIGFLGAGKTTLARNLGRMFHRPYVDTDRMSERILSRSIEEIFEQLGEDAFRDAETRALRKLQAKKSMLVSCGGGIVERPENIELMRSMGTVVFLEGDLEDSLKQIRYFPSRPDFRTAKEAQELYDRRLPLYRQACDLTISITDKDFTDVAQEAGALLWEQGLL